MACHKPDLWSKQENVLVEETNQRPLKKPLKNGFAVLYLSLTKGQEPGGGVGPWKELPAV
jgi:hypothetical protein